MQNSKIFLGINIAATLSVAISGQAKALDNAGGTADFLKSSLSDFSTKKTLKAVKVKTQLRKKSRFTSRQAVSHFSSPKSVDLRSSFKIDHTKLSVGKKLPTRGELALKKQHAQMDKIRVQEPLKGNVQSYTNFYLSSEVSSALKSPKAKRSTKRQARRTASHKVQKAKKLVSKLAPRTKQASIQNHNPVIPGQVGHPCASIHSMDVRKFEANKHIDKAIAKSVQTNQLAAPHLSNKEQVELANLARVLFLKDKLNHKSSQSNHFHSPLDSNLSAHQRVDRAYAKNGPPPFPLNLIPEPAMKDFLSKARNRKSVIRSYPNAFAKKPGTKSGAGFQSFAKNMRHGGFTSYSRYAINFSHNYSKAPRSHITHSRSSQIHTVSHKPRTTVKYQASRSSQGFTPQVVHKAHAKVATYGPYGSKPTFRGL